MKVTTSMTDADPHRGWLDERDAKLAYQRSPKGAALPDDEFNKISEEQCALEGRVINTPAFTPEGLAAQNQVLREYLEDGAMEPEVTVKLHEAILKSTAAVHGAASTATEADAAATADVIVNLFAERNRLCILYTEASDQDQPGEIVTEAHRKYSEIDGQIIDATAATPLGVAIKFWVACAYAEDCQIFDVRIGEEYVPRAMIAALNDHCAMHGLCVFGIMQKIGGGAEWVGSDKGQMVRRPASEGTGETKAKPDAAKVRPAGETEPTKIILISMTTPPLLFC
jgi:hypothetical protein